MKLSLLLLAMNLMTQSLVAQLGQAPRFDWNSQHSAVHAPLHLINGGGGRIFPLHDEQMLKVGGIYHMVAVPDPGYWFTGWNQVNIFTFSSAEIDYNTFPATTNYVTSVNYSPAPISNKKRLLTFTMSPVTVLYNFNGNSLTQEIGWQANFEPTTRRFIH